MKERVINEIKIRMIGIVDSEQLKKLTDTLNYVFKSLEMSEKETPDNKERTSNEYMLNTFIDAKRIEGCSEKSLIYYFNTLQIMLTQIDRPVKNIETDDLRGYLSEYQRTRSISKITVDNMRRIFSSFFSWLEDEDYIYKNPVRRIHKVKTEKLIKETFNDEHLEKLRDYCVEIRDLAMIDLLASTGMRVGELIKLNRDDINFHERECVVFGKGGTERSVYFDARTKLHLSKYIEGRKDKNIALFVSLMSPHNRLSIGGIETRLREIGNRADVYNVYPHKFRRSLATKAIDKGMPIEQVQKLLGHVKIDTTMHYAMVNQINVKNSHRKYIG